MVRQGSGTLACWKLRLDSLEKVACLGFSLIQNHPFVDGNKRVGHAAMEVVLVLNGIELVADVDEAETLVLGVAQGVVNRDGLTRWLADHHVPMESA